MPSWRRARQYGSADCSHNLFPFVPLRDLLGRALKKEHGPPRRTSRRSGLQNVSGVTGRRQGCRSMG
jgi:hypothetical protein